MYFWQFLAAPRVFACTSAAVGRFWDRPKSRPFNGERRHRPTCGEAARKLRGSCKCGRKGATFVVFLAVSCISCIFLQPLSIFGNFIVFSYTFLYRHCKNLMFCSISRTSVAVGRFSGLPQISPLHWGTSTSTHLQVSCREAAGGAANVVERELLTLYF